MITLPRRKLRVASQRLIWALPIAVTLVLPACSKPDDDLGLDLLPGDPLGVVIDTVQLHAFTFADTAVRTNGLSVQLLGSYFDPQFGPVKAGVVAQLRLSSNIALNFNNAGLVADSLVLAMPFNGVDYGYGNFNAQTFRVYEIAEDLSLDSNYYADRTPQVINTDLVADHRGTITPEPLSVAIVGDDSLPPQLRIPLSLDLAERFLDEFGSANLASGGAFLEFFKGVYVTVDNPGQLPNQGGILYLALTGANSKATLYYHDLNDQPDLLRSLDLLINSNSVRYTVVEHLPELAIDQTLPAALDDTISAASTVHVQTLGGARTAVRMPSVMGLDSTGRVLAKAEFILPVQGSFYPYYLPPATLFLFRKDTAGNDVFLPDQLAGIGAIDGNYRASERSYHFNITRYVQRVLNGTYPNTGFEIVPGSNGVSANRVVLSGPAAAEDPMRLRLTFTTY